MKKETAKQVGDLMINIQSKLNESIIVVQNNCSDEEFKQYRKTVAYIMGDIITDIMNPIYKEYPDLLPEQMQLNKDRTEE